MKNYILGRTGIEVTELCFGALPMGPLQKNLHVHECAQIVEAALKKGINFIDTAQAYKTYEPIKMAMDKTGIRPVIASKSMQKTYDGMKMAVDEALQKLGLDYIDIFHIHAPRDGEKTFEIFKDALRCLRDLKSMGKIKAVGIATHCVSAVNQAAETDYIDVVFPLINVAGRGIIGGTKEEMEVAILKASRAGKGIYIMKSLAGGTLINDYENAIKYVRSIGSGFPIAMGMISLEEVEYNIRYFSGEDINTLPETIKSSKRFAVIKGVCKGCGACITACPNKAISYDTDDKALIDVEICLTCGYCTPVCPEFAIRML